MKSNDERIKTLENFNIIGRKNAPLPRCCFYC